MGGTITRCAKKVWSGIKKVGGYISKGVKYVGKVVKKAAKIVGSSIAGIIVTAAVAATLVAGTVITAVLHSFGLALFFGSLAVLSIIFLSSAIIFGRRNVTQKEEKDNTENDEVDEEDTTNNLGPSRNKPNLDDDPKEKPLNHVNIFFKDIEEYIKEAIKEGEIEEKEHLYTFKIGENSEISVKKVNELPSSKNKNEVATYVNFEFINNDNAKLINLKFYNEPYDEDCCKKTMVYIKDYLTKQLKKEVVFIEPDNNNNKKIDISMITDIQTIHMGISLN